EYKSASGAWTDVTGTEITGLATGTYQIRVKATVSSFKSAEKIIAITAPNEYTVTIGNGGIGSNGSGSYTSGVTVSVYAGSRSGYTFIGWTSTDGVTFANASSATTSFMMPAQNVTVIANWSYNGSSSPSGGSNSDRGSSENMPSITIDKNPNQPTVASVSLTATVDQNGVASAVVTEAQVRTWIDAARKEAQNKGNTADGVAIVCHIQFDANGNSFNVKLEEGALALLEKEGIKRFAVNTSLVSFSFDEIAIREMNAQASGAVTLGADPVTVLSDAATALIGSRPVYDLIVSYTKEGKTAYVTNFGKGVVTLDISHKPTSSEKTSNFYPVYVNKGGKPQFLIRSQYDNGNLIFSRNSLSVYGVGYLLPAPAFVDTATHWAKVDIDYVVSRGLISGTGKATFSPDTAVTRADFLMALGMLSGADMSAYQQSSFTDVSITSAAWPYIEWAVQNKIVQGIGDNKFDPESPITREQMAVMMVGYAQVTGDKLPVRMQVISFADDIRISSWAKEAVKTIQQAGVVNGKENNLYDPAGMATRAEASAILRRFTETVVDKGQALQK
ncbi:S-layer homology domain-containing protein, partial [Paenibacillus whitsoniae]